MKKFKQNVLFSIVFLFYFLFFLYFSLSFLYYQYHFYTYKYRRQRYSYSLLKGKKRACKSILDENPYKIFLVILDLFLPLVLFREVNCPCVATFEVQFANEKHGKVLLKPKSIVSCSMLWLCIFAASQKKYKDSFFAWFKLSSVPQMEEISRKLEKTSQTPFESLIYFKFTFYIQKLHSSSNFHQNCIIKSTECRHFQ